MPNRTQHENHSTLHQLCKQQFLGFTRIHTVRLHRARIRCCFESNQTFFFFAFKQYHHKQKQLIIQINAQYGENPGETPKKKMFDYSQSNI